MAWALEAFSVAQIARRHRDGAALAGSVGFLTLGAAHALAAEAPFESVATGATIGLLDAMAVAALGSAAFACARMLRACSPETARVLNGAAAVTGAYLAAATLDGAAVAAAWGGAAILLAAVASRVRSQQLVVTAGGFAALALSHTLIFEAPFETFLYGASSLGAAAIALAASAGGPLVLARLRWLDRQTRVVVATAGALTLLYLVSVAIVSVVGSGESQSVIDLAVRQQGQALVSALWGVVGVAALIAGLRRDTRELRTGALLLLLATAGKVFVFDLAALTSIYRVASFIALGLLLLAGSFAYQRLRPVPIRR
jgi:hypothetical protein